jgi:hypothetical protein
MNGVATPLHRAKILFGMSKGCDFSQNSIPEDYYDPGDGPKPRTSDFKADIKISTSSMSSAMLQKWSVATILFHIEEFTGRNVKTSMVSPVKPLPRLWDAYLIQ